MCECHHRGTPVACVRVCVCSACLYRTYIYIYISTHHIHTYVSRLPTATKSNDTFQRSSLHIYTHAYIARLHPSKYPSIHLHYCYYSTTTYYTRKRAHTTAIVYILSSLSSSHRAFRSWLFAQKNERRHPVMTATRECYPIR